MSTINFGSTISLKTFYEERYMFFAQKQKQEEVTIPLLDSSKVSQTRAQLT